MQRSEIPSLGHGVGLRPWHYRNAVAGDPRIEWFEIISENFINAGGRPHMYWNKCASATLS
jgi:uncharacterized protein